MSQTIYEDRRRDEWKTEQWSGGQLTFGVKKMVFSMLAVIRNLPMLVDRRIEKRMRAQLLNFPGFGNIRALPLPTIRFSGLDVSPKLEIIERIAAAYRRSMGSGASSGDGVWEAIYDRAHSALANALSENDLNSAGEILSGMFRNNACTSGLALGEVAYHSTRRSPFWTALDWQDKVISLGTALGVLPVENPEQGEFGSLLFRDSSEVLRRCEEILGFSSIPPQVGGLFGPEFNGQIVPVNQILHLYTAHRILQISQSEPLDCLEIGGGVGFLAHCIGLKGARRFTILDLAIVNVMQAYLLLNSSIADSVCLFGESIPASDSPLIEILLETCLNSFHDGSFNLIVNQDSLPEMSEMTMAKYLETIPRLSRRYFLCINQEAQSPTGAGENQGWVFDSCRCNSSFKLEYRMPYWLRKGYTEELWQVTKNFL